MEICYIYIYMYVYGTFTRASTNNLDSTHDEQHIKLTGLKQILVFWRDGQCYRESDVLACLVQEHVC